MMAALKALAHSAGSALRGDGCSLYTQLREDIAALESSRCAAAQFLATAIIVVYEAYPLQAWQFLHVHVRSCPVVHAFMDRHTVPTNLLGMTHASSFLGRKLY